MNQDRAAPPIWFRLPPGFHDIGPGDRGAVDRIADALGRPDARRDLGRLMDNLDELTAHHVVHTSVGLHPVDPVGVSASFFSLTVRNSDHANPRVSVAQTALAIARSTLWMSSARRFIDLPSSQPCCLVAGIISAPGVEQPVFQARAVMAHPEGGHVLVLDLTSAATEHADAYTSILEAVAHTVSFSNPDPDSDPGPAGKTATSRILDLLL
ncbi:MULTISPECIES: hypothetical protein [unclassified Streptomyces]|uniref:hypothetical protein n=1 Tax=unclassified Streptomyces TaxID=2593676 RepID=UPI001BE62EB7|nr:MULTISPECIES: hypothetical protein [unclassified Streptomyces]MBT2407366.1 hypothetical protein [Streptomyces sp. ISL-21]MBT2455443.1 hypothetical protein [Streptomyces sp. ISL-86]MBT2611045.1 hypothetical protein [Streptomyces sp. ISL-87]